MNDKELVKRLFVDVAEVFDVDKDLLTIKCKKQEVITARFCVYLFLFDVMEWNKQRIGRATPQGYDHSCVINALKKIKGWCDYDTHLEKQKIIAFRKMRTTCEHLIVEGESGEGANTRIPVISINTLNVQNY